MYISISTLSQTSTSLYASSIASLSPQTATSLYISSTTSTISQTVTSLYTSLATSKSPDQQEIIDLGANFVNLNASLSSYCLSIQVESYYSWKATNIQPTSYITKCNQSPCLSGSAYVENLTPEYTPQISPPCCGQRYVQARTAYAVFWPTPAPQPNVSRITAADGFV